MRLLRIALFALAGCGSPPVIVVEPLQVVAWVPNRGARCVRADALDFEASVTFSDYLNPATLTPASLFVRPEGEEALAVRITSDGRTQTATLRLDADLDYGAVYELVATDAIEGVERGHLTQELVSPFTTITPAGCL
jgi:hypothetical protein